MIIYLVFQLTTFEQLRIISSGWFYSQLNNLIVLVAQNKAKDMSACWRLWYRNKKNASEGTLAFKKLYEKNVLTNPISYANIKLYFELKQIYLYIC